MIEERRFTVYDLKQERKPPAAPIPPPSIYRVCVAQCGYRQDIENCVSGHSWDFPVSLYEYDVLIASDGVMDSFGSDEGFNWETQLCIVVKVLGEYKLERFA